MHLVAGIGEDAVAYQCGDKLMVQSVDMITPVVDDPFQFGAIAAANALSDIYAKGGVPLFALNIVGFPASSLPLQYLEEIMKGGAAKAKEAGIFIAGGHTIEDSCPKYGLVVTGFVPNGKFIPKSGAQPGDFVYLTKPLGIGIYTTGIDRKILSSSQIDAVQIVMNHLNNKASEAMCQGRVHACTDVTGFGFIGHLLEIAEQSNVSVEVDCKSIPYLPDTFDLVRRGAISQGIMNNLFSYKHKVTSVSPLTEEEEWVLHDPQTSGGLIIVVPPEEAASLVARLKQQNEIAYKIGEIVEQQDSPIITKNNIL